MGRAFVWLFALQCVWSKRRLPGPGSGRYRCLLLCWGHGWEERCSEEHTEVHRMQVYLITGAKARSQGSKADWDYWRIQHRALIEPGIQRSGFPGNGESGRHSVSLCLSLSETVPALVSCFFQCILALDFCSLMTATCLGLAWNCSVRSFSSPYSSTA